MTKGAGAYSAQDREHSPVPRLRPLRRLRVRTLIPSRMDSTAYAEESGKDRACCAAFHEIVLIDGVHPGGLYEHAGDAKQSGHNIAKTSSCCHIPTRRKQDADTMVNVGLRKPLLAVRTHGKHGIDHSRRVVRPSRMHKQTASIVNKQQKATAFIP